MNLRRRNVTASLSNRVGIPSRECGRKTKEEQKLLVQTMVDTKSRRINTIFKELRLTDHDDFKKYLRMNEETFEELLARVRPYITKLTTRLCKLVPPSKNLRLHYDIWRLAKILRASCIILEFTPALFPNLFRTFATLFIKH